MRLAIVGSAELTAVQHTAARFLVEGVIRNLRDVNGGLTVVSGGAPGVDTIAEKFARTVLDTEPEIYYPEHSRWAPKGYKDRNMLIAERCDMLVRISSRDGTTYGSGWTADYAERLGKPVMRYWV